MNNDVKKTVIFCAGFLDSLTDCKKVFDLSKRYIPNTVFVGLGDAPDDHDEKIYYVQPGKSKIVTLVKIIYYLKINIKANKTTTIYMYYFPGCSLVKAFTKSQFIVDVRTGTIRNSRLMRTLYNYLIKIETSVFEKIVVISEGVKVALGLPDRSVVISLGADPTHINRQSNIDFAYVGTYKQRNLHILVKAYLAFLKSLLETGEKFNNLPKLHIVGDGPESDMKLVANVLQESEFQSVVILWGRKEGTQLTDILSKCHFGISFIPITDYFDHQPPTKTFEYLVNGMPVVATSTKANLDIVNADNGFCCKDTIKDFSAGLEHVYRHKHKFSVENIMINSVNYHWINVFEQGQLKILKTEL